MRLGNKFPRELREVGAVAERQVPGSTNTHLRELII